MEQTQFQMPTESQIQQSAQAAYARLHWNEATVAQQMAFYGVSEAELKLRFPQHLATVADFATHIRTCAMASAEHNVRLEWDRFPLGTSQDAIDAAAADKARSKRRSAGARALVRKYGHEAAESIVANKTGRRINLQ